MQPPETLRFIKVTATGVLHWLAQPDAGPERAVIECLLSMDSQRPVNLRVMSASLSWPVAQLARVLFALNRSQGIQVDLDAPLRDESGGDALAGLDDDLQTLAGTGQCALLASNDGLCLGAVGWSDEEAEQMAGRLALESGQANTAPVLTWFFARERVVLCADPGVDQRDPAWVGVARRLLRACGPLRLEPGLA
ncbi:MAG: hypothetical protein Q8M93_19845 [Polaromonas sp.]|uniref:hypothetical protein n=1 Tax=Polaromonas sp. TaxID=1869339 RepID=UPI00272FED3C|nr:hypothetical protein [Polaromonas sp.]MDP2451150.1 hypothetical protein [Polaromonas sp.]MDP3249204.1 hypothetical protein [Polaromonas sp.]MDP3756931.1 hypothetical protein [Polaromonas sp.]